MISMLDPKTLTVFATGATSGFGEAICHRFHDAGAKGYCCGNRVYRSVQPRAHAGPAQQARTISSP